MSERERGTDRVVESTTGERFLGRGEAGGRGERAVCVGVSKCVCACGWVDYVCMGVCVCVKELGECGVKFVCDSQSEFDFNFREQPNDANRKCDKTRDLFKRKVSMFGFFFISTDK